jgi:hypothetical protein
MSDDQRCGTCRWWLTGFESLRGFDLGVCHQPNAFRFNTVATHDGGADCPCYERKERDEREGAD